MSMSVSRSAPCVVALALLGIAVPATILIPRLAPVDRSPQARQCLCLIAHNLARGNGNYFLYYQFADSQIKIQDGDKLTYEVFLDPKNPVAKGGIDIDFADDGEPLRDLGLRDQAGVRAHGDGLLTGAVGKWYSRTIPLAAAAGRTTKVWSLAFEGDPFGRYVQFVDRVFVEHADGTKSAVYDGGTPRVRTLKDASGYSKNPTCVPIDRAKVREGADLEPTIASVKDEGEKLAAIAEARNDIELVKQFLKRNPSVHLDMHVQEAVSLIDALDHKETVSAEELQAVLHAARHALSHTHPEMAKYTGHLVGHAHIDLQWLWEWQEGIVSAHDTFNQAVKFMDQYPGFCFSQSSSVLYKTVEDYYPDLFAKMKAKVKSGQWEIVGGRVCEGDTNMISAESHARHFLYGQRYFRERFGKTATVGWEPDTFGHTLQMPQILKLGGCDYYYFCRGGKGKPLFWRTGLDGSKVLAFDEPANGSWYNSDVSYKQFQNMLNFKDKTGAQDMLWVYGVGNHGGGPTKENIETALAMMKKDFLPTVKFSTASQFFKKLSTYDLTKIPTVNQELNPVFDGCYTSHAEVKKLNRDAEAATTSAEAIAATASLFGFAYPQASFRRNWEDIAFNHHHDTLPGSGIHPPYENTKITLGRVLADDRDIVNRAMEMMTLRVTPKQGGLSVMVFNPTGWTRSAWIPTMLVQSGWNGGEGIDPNRCKALAPDGKAYPVIQDDTHSHAGRFWAAEVPAFGYKVFQIVNGSADVGTVETRDDGFTMESKRFIVEFDRAQGTVKRMFDKQAGREVVASAGSMGRLEMHYETPGGMSAWVIGKIAKVERLVPANATATQGPGYAEVQFDYEMPSVNNPSKPTTITQTFRLESTGRELDCDVYCDWNEIGSGSTPNPMLRVAFDAAIDKPIATYEIPFGALSRPTDGRESAALEWGDLGDSRYGVSFLNDSKHGYSATANTMRLSLIRSSYEPDPVPNPGEHSLRYAIYPHSGSWKDAGSTRVAAEFNQAMTVATVPFDARGDRPLEWSPLHVTDDAVMPTCLKRCEDDGSLVLRVYQSTGAPSTGAISLSYNPAYAAWVTFWRTCWAKRRKRAERFR